MKRTFNYTGRRNIDRKDVAVTLHESGRGWSFDAELKLAHYKFPSTAEIWIEAHRQNLWMQWSWGTVSLIRIPESRQLTEFDVPDGVLFRVRIVQPPGNEKYKLLGEADGVQPVKAGETNDLRRPLIEPFPDDLDQELWKLDLEEEPPRLKVNKYAKPSWKDLARSPFFIALVYPQVLREILSKVLVEEKWSEEDEEEDWRSDWIRFTRNLGGLASLPSPEQRDEREAWIEEAVASFARKMQLRSVWNKEHEEEGPQ